LTDQGKASMGQQRREVSSRDLESGEQATDKRTRIVDTAARLVHEQGLGPTSLADIARESGVPLGNLYYYFKTKDAIGEALVERISTATAAARATWDAELEPRERIVAFVQATIDDREGVARHGCRVGALCSELHKEPGPLAERAATLFDDFLKWLEAQFRLIGKGAESRDLAFHLVSSVQGASLLANTFHSTRQLTRECNRLKEWVRSL
jgi:TetR/AcrR family transcriptional regulator, transcriptional repressor for nem operon